MDALHAHDPAGLMAVGLPQGDPLHGQSYHESGCFQRNQYIWRHYVKKKLGIAYGTSLKRTVSKPVRASLPPCPS